MRLSTLVETSDGALVPVGSPLGDPRVTSVVTTDLLDPRRYLAGRELVLTGLAWWRPDRPGRTREFVSALVDARVAALAAGEAELGGVPDDLVEACADAGLPLLRVPLAVSFATVTEHAHRHLSTSRSGDLAAVLGRHRALIAAESAGSGLAGVLDLVATDLDLRCWVLAPTGRLVAGTAGPPDERERRLLAQHYLRAARLPHRVRRPSGRTVSIFGAGATRVASWLLAIAEDNSGWSPERLGVVEELASLVDLERRVFGRRSDVEHQLAAALSSSASDVVAAMGRAGLDPAHRSVVIVGQGPLAATVLAEVLAVSQEGEWRLGSHETDVVAVLPTTQDSVADDLRAVVDRLGSGVGSLHIGVSDPVVGGDGLLAAAAEARMVASTLGPESVGGSDRLSSHGLLLAAVPEPLRSAYRARVLGPLLEHDRVHRTELVRTLSAYLECSGSWSRCAARMHLHVNTLRYRIERIEALTGRDLRHLPDQVDLLLALRAPPSL